MLINKNGCLYIGGRVMAMTEERLSSTQKIIQQVMNERKLSYKEAIAFLLEYTEKRGWEKTNDF